MHCTLSSLLVLTGGVAATIASSRPAATDPVCVVGAGPAGLRAARALEDKGRTVVVFEKQETVGGKCQAYYDGPDGDTFHPLGALLLENTTYVETSKVIAQTKVPYLATSGLGPKWNFHWRTGEIGPYPTLTDEQREVLRGEVARYVGFWETSYAPISAVGYRSPIPTELTVTVAEWLQQNDYHVLPVVFNLGMFPYGYVGGEDEATQTQECSALVLAFPPTVEALTAAGLEVSDDEKELFTAVRLINYFSGPVSMGVPAGDLYYANSTSPTVPPAADGRPVGFIRLFNESDVVTTWSWGAPNETYTETQGRRLLLETLFGINKDTPGDPAGTSVAVTDADVRAFSKHDYFPHVGGTELAGGWYVRFHLLQGQDKTYYASGLNGFEMVEYALQAGKDVVGSYF